MIPVEIVNVILSDKGFVILLKSREDNRALPIFIGQLEAQSIIIALSDARPVRPLTHDLIKTMLEDLSCSIVRVEVCDLINDTFYGKIIIEHNGLPVEFDSRPSDAIALAVRTQAPIFVAAKVMDEAKIIIEENETVTEEAKTEDDPVPVAQAGPVAQVEDLKQQLDKAINQEQYEEAAKLRDLIRKKNTTN
jgi:bifunctional DNase/RNase